MCGASIFKAFNGLNFFFPRDLLSEFRSTLTEENTRKPLLMLIDGVDLVEDCKAQLSSDWIPLEIPKVSKRQVDVAAWLQSVRK